MAIEHRLHWALAQSKHLATGVSQQVVWVERQPHFPSMLGDNQSYAERAFSSEFPSLAEGT
ncbi:hypothetical protein WI23_00845 [Burkholderia oklahomensis C6786]|nr:hypothetical protein WI23_00845 [Burkholderia oklahomensis C6786]KUY61514.1 hypothetical protein WI23_09985 [Burkholderia oklahomensis C6786]